MHGDFYKKLPAMAQNALQEISGFMQGMSAYYEAQSSYEQAIMSKKYDKLINAAGNNTARQKKLKEKNRKTWRK